jgi:hypothetical protein
MGAQLTFVCARQRVGRRRGRRTEADWIGEAATKIVASHEIFYERERGVGFHEDEIYCTTQLPRLKLE